MKNIAIIAEYNPFHNGHMYHLNTAKELTGADYCIALMSGNFLQRGIPAMWDKYTRGHMATSVGVDLVLELPFPYATGSAKDFATGAINILDRLNTVEYLCFGAETDDINLLTSIADVINSEPDSYKKQLSDALAEGLSFPQARAHALSKYFATSHSDLSTIINQPNNILAIEYIAALRRINSRITPIIIKRYKAMYHDETIYGSISSASAIRNGIWSKDFQLENIICDIPDQVFKLIENNYQHNWPISCDGLTPYLQYKLLNPANYGAICDISEDLANKLRKVSPTSGYQEIVDILSSKDLTISRVCRSLIHLIMDYKEVHRNQFIDAGYAQYANILSFRRDSSQLIKVINQQSLIPLITKKADFEKCLSNYPDIDANIASLMWEYDTKATTLYNCLVYNSYNAVLPNDFNTQIPIV